MAPAGRVVIVSVYFVDSSSPKGPSVKHITSFIGVGK